MGLYLSAKVLFSIPRIEKKKIYFVHIFPQLSILTFIICHSCKIFVSSAVWHRDFFDLKFSKNTKHVFHKNIYIHKIKSELFSSWSCHLEQNMKRSWSRKPHGLLTSVPVKILGYKAVCTSVEVFQKCYESTQSRLDKVNIQTKASSFIIE